MEGSPKQVWSYFKSMDGALAAGGVVWAGLKARIWIKMSACVMLVYDDPMRSASARMTKDTIPPDWIS